MEREKNRFIWLNKTTEFFKQTIDTKWKNLDSKIYFLFRFKHHRDGDVKHGERINGNKKIIQIQGFYHKVFCFLFFSLHLNLNVYIKNTSVLKKKVKKDLSNNSDFIFFGFVYIYTCFIHKLIQKKRRRR